MRHRDDFFRQGRVLGLRLLRRLGLYCHRASIGRSRRRGHAAWLERRSASTTATDGRQGHQQDANEGCSPLKVLVHCDPGKIPNFDCAAKRSRCIGEAKRSGNSVILPATDAIVKRRSCRCSNNITAGGLFPPGPPKPQSPVEAARFFESGLFSAGPGSILSIVGGRVSAWKFTNATVASLLRLFLARSEFSHLGAGRRLDPAVVAGRRPGTNSGRCGADASPIEVPRSRARGGSVRGFRAPCRGGCDGFLRHAGSNPARR